MKPINIISKLNESEAYEVAGFNKEDELNKLHKGEEKLDRKRIRRIFKNIKPETEYSGYEIDNSGICIEGDFVNEDGELEDGVVFYSEPTKNYVFKNVEGSDSFDIQAPRFLRDKEGNEYGDTIGFKGSLSDEKIKSIFDEINANKKEYDPNDKDERGFAKIIESTLDEENRYGKTEDNDPVLDKTIKVYDINKWIDDNINNESEEQYQSFDYNNGAAIIVTKDGEGCILNYEAVGSSFNATSDTVTIYICPKEHKDENGHMRFSIMATASFKVTIDELMTAPSKEMKVKDFFYKYKYNDRCARNFDEIKHYIEDLKESNINESINLDETKYYIIGEKDFNKLLDLNNGAFEDGYIEISKDEANELAKKQGLVAGDNGINSGEEG